MPELHPLFEAAIEVGQEAAQRLKESKEQAKGPDFGMERVDREGWRERVRGDGSFRKQQLETLGRDGFMRRYGKAGR